MTSWLKVERSVLAALMAWAWATRGSVLLGIESNTWFMLWFGVWLQPWPIGTWVPCNCEEMIAAIHSYTYYKNVASYGHDIASLFFI